MTLPRFISVLRSAGLDPDAESLADFFFYAAYLPSAASQAAKDQQRAAAASDTSQSFKPAASGSTSPGTLPVPPLGPQQDPAQKKSGLFSATAALEKGTIPAQEIEVPEAPALPRAVEIARSLRPLSRHFPIPGFGDLDDEATAEQSAHQRQLVIAFRQRHERWFDVALVVEDTPSMAIWKQTIAAFERLLANQGAFRDVRRWRLIGDGSLTGPSGQPATANALVAPSGRRMLLILTHGASNAWQSTALAAAVSKWAHRQPTAVIQLLPTRLWQNSRLGEPKAEAKSSRPGLPNSQWDVAVPAWLRRRMPMGLPLPILTLDPESVGNWANMLMARSGVTVPAAYWSVVTATDAANTTQNEDLSAEQRLDSFNRIALDDGRRLASVLSAGPINLPILRLVNQTIFGDKARNETIAEVLLGGILRKTNDLPADPEQVEYDFYPGLRTLFAASLHSDDRFAARRQVMQYLLQHPDTTQRFRVLVPHKDGKRLLPEWATPFADEDDAFLRSYQLSQDIDPYHPPALPPIEKETSEVADLLPDSEFDEFLRHLPEFLAKQRWFASKVRSISTVSMLDWAKVPLADFSFAFVSVEYSGDAGAETYVLPMSQANGAWIQLRYDAVTWAALFALIENRASATTNHGHLQWRRAANYEAIRGAEITHVNPVSGASGPRLSTRLGSLIMKIYPRLEGGENPNAEMCRYFSEEVPFSQVVPYAGSLEYTYRNNAPVTFALMHGAVANAGNAWTRATDELEDPSLRGPFVMTLGRRIAQMHLALAAGTLPAFAPQPAASDYLSQLADQMLEHALTVLDSSSKVRLVSPEMRRLLNAKSKVEAVFRRAKTLSSTFNLIRIHGDLHLNQLLKTADDFVFADFEGDPSRSLAQRRSKQCALKDIASMIRSISYLANAGRGDMRIHPWEHSVTEKFIAAYREEAGTASFLPAHTATFDVLLDAFLLDKALHELAYELANRPSWARIPLKGILELLEAPEPQPAANGGQVQAEQPQKTEGSSDEQLPVFETVREVSSQSVVIFADIGTLESDGWAALARFLANDDSLASWNILIMRFAAPVLASPESDPNMPSVVRSLKLQLTASSLQQYEEIALVAHSFGGLAVQRALLDSPELVKRTSHVFLFATPSAGLGKDRSFRLSLGSGSSVSTNSPFIRQLREDWNQQFGTTPPFNLYAVAGEMEQFVPPESSLTPFAESSRKVMPGDHISMARPDSANDMVVRLLVNALNSPRETSPPKEKLTAKEWFTRGYNSDDPDEQIACYNEAVRLNPKDYYSFFNRAIAHTEKGDIDRALEDYTSAIQLRSDDADSFMNRAMVLSDLGDLEGALRDYDMAVRLSPGSTEILMNRGIARAEKSDLDGALRDYDSVLRLSPNDANAFYNRAIAHSQKGDQSGALADYNQSIRLERDNPAAFRYRAEILRNQGELDGALNDLNEAMRLSPDDVDVAEALDGLAESYLLHADFDTAESLYKQSLAIKKKAFGERDPLAAYREALQVMQRLAAADPSNAGRQRDLSVSQDNVGSVLRDQGDLTGALAAYRESLQVMQRLAAADPSNAGWQRDLSVSLNNIGSVLRDQGDLAGALAAYRESLQVMQRLAAADPSNTIWQRDLSYSLSEIVSLLESQGNSGDALEVARERLAIDERLAALDPSNAIWKKDREVSRGLVLRLQS
jgi:predicted trehalose synthase/tetratricopeptide (TPR) repeat protein